jgi:hypothetical protein
MIPDFLRSKLPHFERGETALGMVPAQATLLPDAVTSSRYATLERLYIEACHDRHRQTRIAEHLRAELPEVQAEHEALQIVAKTARLTLPPSPSPDPGRHSAFMAELIDSVGGFSYPDPVLPPRPIGEAALRRAFSTLSIEARTVWSEARTLQREIAALEARVQHHRQAVVSLLTLLAGKTAAASGVTSQSLAPARAGSLQEGITLRLRPNHIVGALIAFLSFSILTGLLIVNSAAVTGRTVPTSPAPAARISTSAASSPSSLAHIQDRKAKTDFHEGGHK